MTGESERPDARPVRRPGSPDDGRRSERGRDDGAVLPRGSESERDEAWGDEPRSQERDAEWYRRERPPHHE